jgi:hypothetical protein
LKGVVGREESALVSGEGPRVASSAYLTRIRGGSLDDTDGGALKPYQDVENNVSPSTCSQPRAEDSTDVRSFSQQGQLE